MAGCAEERHYEGTQEEDGHVTRGCVQANECPVNSLPLHVMDY